MSKTLLRMFARGIHDAIYVHIRKLLFNILRVNNFHRLLYNM